MSCKCQLCGRQYKVDVIVNDELWERIKPAGKPVGGGMLCGSCIASKIEALGVYASYHLSQGVMPMPARSYERGWPIVMDGGKWVYEDTREVANGARPCKRCGNKPNPDGSDSCLGNIPGVSSACCGHGVEPPYSVEHSARRIREGGK